MGLSLFLAKLIGIFMIVIALIWLIRKKQFEVAFMAILTEMGPLALSGVNILIVGLAIAIGHPIWELSWRGLITLIGYLAIIQGVVRLGFYHRIKKTSSSILRHGYWMILILAVIGIYLTYYGFRGSF